MSKRNVYSCVWNKIFCTKQMNTHLDLANKKKKHKKEKKRFCKEGGCACFYVFHLKIWNQNRFVFFLLKQYQLNKHSKIWHLLRRKKIFSLCRLFFVVGYVALWPIYIIFGIFYSIVIQKKVMQSKEECQMNRFDRKQNTHLLFLFVYLRSDLT